MTANPQITAGNNGQVLILHGTSDTNTVELIDGNGVDLRGGSIVLGAGDALCLLYSTDSGAWEELYRNVPTMAVVWPFSSPAGTSGTYYVGGFYYFSGTNNDFSPAINFGTANSSYAAHFMIVTGAATVDELTIRVTGTSIDDNGNRQAGDTQDIVIPNATPADTYYETSKKWLGQVQISVVSGTAQQCNYGFCKYWDRRNSDFRLCGFEALWRGGANDAGANIRLRHHKTTGWTYNVGADPTPPTALADMATTHSTERNVVNGENGAFKVTDINQLVEGTGEEGILIEIVTTANKAFDLGSAQVCVRPA